MDVTSEKTSKDAASAAPQPSAPKASAPADATPTPETSETTKISADAKPKEKEQPTSDFRPGYTVRIHQRIKEGEKERVQIFEGMILAVHGKNPIERTITVRKISHGVGVEKIFPLALPTIEKIELVKKAEVRRAKLYYLRKYSKRLKEVFVK